MRSYLLLSIILISISACEELFESTTDLELPATIDKLVVQSRIDLGKDTFEMLVTHSRNILDIKEIISLEMANISITTDQSTLDFQFNEDGEILDHTSYVINKQRQALPGETWRLSVMHEGFEPISSTAVVPHPPQILSAKYTLESAKDFEGYDVDELILELEDVDSEENYYSVNAYEVYIDTFIYQLPGQDSIVRIFQQNSVYLQEDGLTTFRGLEGKILFDDATFSGKKGQIRIQGNYYNSRHGQAPEITVEVVSISKDRYLFELSVERSASNDGNPFVEPDNVHTNVSNGYGVFSVENGATLKVKVE